MDAVDLQIIQIMREDARLPLKTIAGKVGLARSSVRSRIDRLEAMGVIRGYSARVANIPPVVGAVLCVSLRQTPDPATVAALVQMPEVRRCLSLAGEIDLLVELAAGDVRELNDARDRIASLASVARVTTSLIPNRDKESDS